PSWSPDGKTIAYTTDISGEQQIAIRPAEGGPEKILTHFARGYFYTPRWSPSGDHLIFTDNEHRLWVLATAGGEPVQIAQDPFQEVQNYTWAPDGHWVAYVLTGANQQSGIWLYNLEAHKSTRVSDPRSNDFNPTFDAAGKYLYFISTRHENPTFSRTEFNIATLKMTGIYVATLKRGTASLFAPRSDEGVPKEDHEASSDEHKESAEGQKESSEDQKDKKSSGKKRPSAASVEIELDGLMTRAVPMPITPADIASFDVRDDKVFYLTTPSPMIEGPLPGEKPVLHVYDLKKRKDENIVDGLSAYALSDDGKKVLYKLDKDYYIADAAPGKDKDEDAKKKLDLSHMKVRVEPTREWAEMFNSAWRLERDLFYSPQMNGVNWPAVHESYRKLLPLVGSRSDLNYLIGEVIGELSNSHTYVGGGDDMPEERRVPTAFLGADFALEDSSGRYRLATILPGDNTHDAYRSPLTAPGLDVHAGDYLLAIDGTELKAPMDPFSLLVGKQDST